ncbi:hypothetical protein MPAR168_10430 [Methylorubrum populi]|uniref:Autotransporter domain-containing protein n=1 Tax=Methylobacterium radiotolerans TaxID=31998 RepID=A0ABU7TGU8_9HYPH
MRRYPACGARNLLKALLASTALLYPITVSIASEVVALPRFARLVDAPGIVPPSSPSSARDSAEDFRTQEYRADYGLEQIGAARAYARGYTGAGILVAVVDSGLDGGHPEFAGRISPGSRNFDIGYKTPGDFSDQEPAAHGHGTHVSGTIGAARDGVGMHGVAFDATILALRAISTGGNANAAIDAATAQGARVVNGSYGPAYPTIYLPDGNLNPDYVELPTNPLFPNITDEYRAMKRAVDKGTLLVFAAGNDRVDQPLISHNPSGVALFPYIKPENADSGVYQLLRRDGEPADQSHLDFSGVAGSIISVVAVDKANTITWFSNWCGVTADWCIAAPGLDIHSTVPRGTGTGPYLGYRDMSGTSMAAPHVSGAATVLAQAFPFLTAPQLAQTFFTTATSIGPREIYGWGLLNLGKAIDGPGAFTSTWDVDTQGFYGRFANDISGSGGLVKRGVGTLELAGANTYAGATTIAGGTLAINGSVTSPVAVAYAGTLRGTGYLGGSLTSDGVVRPGNSPGTFTVAGPVNLMAGSLLALDIDGTGTGNGRGNYSRLLTAGPLTAGGVLVPILRDIAGEASNGFTPMLGQRFGVVSAAGGLSGSFAGLAQPENGLSGFTRFDALYSAANLDLVVTPARYDDLAAVGLAQSGNARVIGAALDAARPEAGTRPDKARAPLFDALYAAAPGTLGNGLASLAGQTYGDALVADLAGRRLLANTIDRHLTLGGSGVSLQTAESGRSTGALVTLRQGAGADAAPLAVGEGRLWADGLYGFGNRVGDRTASGTRFDAGGLVIGLDRQVGTDMLVGLAFDYLHSSGSSASGELGRFTTDSFGGTLYGAARFGSLELRGSAGFGYSDVRIDRISTVGTNTRSFGATPGGLDAGASAFAGYHLGGELPLALIPEVGFSYDYLNRSRVTEAGSPALGGIGTRNLLAARSLVGGRLTGLSLGDAGGVRLEARAYWAHELADTAALIRSDLFGVGFATRTSRVGRDGALLGLAASGELAPATRLTLSYMGEVRPGATAHGFTAGLVAAW